MAYHIKASDIPMKVRAPHLAAYKTNLRQALLNPGLDPNRKTEIHEKLKHVGEMKQYVKLAALKGQAPKRTLGDALQSMTNSDLYDLGKTEGASVTTRQTKAELIATILSNRETLGG